MKNPLFTLESVLASAEKKTGLSDFGSHDFKPGLEKLLETYTSNGFSEKGDKKNRKRLVDLLCARLRIEKAFALHPEIRDEKISKPLLLTGLPRTGTSALLNLLAEDEQARPLKLWEGLNPEPLEGLEKGQEDPRYRTMKDFFDSMNSEFDKIHATSADTPEECIHLLNHTFCDVQYGVETMMEPYASWFLEQDLSASYNYYADLLKMLQWQRGSGHWLLKTPGHLLALDQLVRLFPDAGIVITHRNPLECVTSYASMMAAMMTHREHFDAKTLGPVVLEFLAVKMERSLAHREHIAPHQIVDIHFNDFVDAPIASAEKIYQQLSMPLSDNSLQAMQAYADAHPMGKHGKHDYQLAEFGLTEAMILKRFDFYLQRFDIAMD